MYIYCIGLMQKFGRIIALGASSRCMPSVQLTAGALSVNVTGDTETDSLSSVSSVAESQMQMLMQEWCRIDGEMVQTHPTSLFG